MARIALLVIKPTVTTIRLSKPWNQWLKILSDRKRLLIRVRSRYQEERIRCYLLNRKTTLQPSSKVSLSRFTEATKMTLQSFSLSTLITIREGTMKGASTRKTWWFRHTTSNICSCNIRISTRQVVLAPQRLNIIKYNRKIAWIRTIFILLIWA